MSRNRESAATVVRDIQRPPRVNRYEEFNAIGRNINERLFACEAERTNLVVLVTHSFFSALPEIEASAMISGKERLLIYLKNSSEDPEFERHLRDEGYRVSSLRKSDFQYTPQNVIDELLERVAEGDVDDLVLLDHGGYFSYHWETFVAALQVRGVVEYALNGESRYLRRKPGGSAPSVCVVSIGQSPLKRFSDYSCGKLIGALTQQIVQEFKGFGLHLRGISRVGVIGFGRLGSRAAEQMRLAGAHNVMVYDSDPAKLVEACQQGFEVSSRNVTELVSKCNLVVVATDSVPIQPEAYDHVVDGTMIATVTSADDSLGLDDLVSRGVLQPRPGGHYEKVRQYETKDGRVVNLIYNGEAPNMRTRIGVDDPTIFMPSVLHALAGLEVAKAGSVDAKKMALLERRVMESYLEAIRDKQGARPLTIFPGAVAGAGVPFPG